MLSTDEQVNPDFHNSTKIFVYECAGSGHQGYVKDAVNVSGEMIYFKAHNITLAVIEFVEKKYQALSTKETLVVLAGDSAGGLAVFMWADYLRSRMVGRILAIADSGYFND
jgi:hypothetical protein